MQITLTWPMIAAIFTVAAFICAAVLWVLSRAFVPRREVFRELEKIKTDFNHELEKKMDTTICRQKREKTSIILDQMKKDIAEVKETGEKTEETVNKINVVVNRIDASLNGGASGG